MSATEKISVGSFAVQCNGQMVPLRETLSYFSATPLEDSELRRLLYDPVSAVPPRVTEILPNLRIVLVPYLEKASAAADSGEPDGSNTHGRKSRKSKADQLVTFERPAESRRLLSATVEQDDQTFLFLAVKEEEVADYHYTFYLGLAALICDRAGPEDIGRFQDLLREELKSEARGEIDEQSWRLKEQLIRRQSDFKRDTKLLRGYFRQALEDTLTLYLHGLCCDIDVDPGPRQLASRHIRRRLLLLRELLPPPAGFALFPEELPERSSH